MVHPCNAINAASSAGTRSSGKPQDEDYVAKGEHISTSGTIVTTASPFKHINSGRGNGFLRNFHVIPFSVDVDGQVVHQVPTEPPVSTSLKLTYLY